MLHDAAATSFAHATADAAKERESVPWALAKVAQGSAKQAVLAASAEIAGAAGAAVRAEELTMASCRAAAEEAVLARSLVDDRTPGHDARWAYSNEKCPVCHTVAWSISTCLQERSIMEVVLVHQPLALSFHLGV